MTKSEAKNLLLAWLLPVLLGLPFIGRAYFVDDHYHLLMARALIEDPLRPYDFRADDAGLDNPGWERGGFPRMVNPPLHHYMLAGLLKLGGGRLWVIRLGMVLFTSLAAVFVFLLARRLVVPPGPAAALAALTPAFWLSTYSLLIDATMLVYFLAGLWAWIEGAERRSAGWALLGGFLLGAAALTKYTAGFGVALAALWWCLQPRERRSWRVLAGLLVPAAMLAGWSVWNIATYGAMHLTESSKRAVHEFRWSHFMIFCVFFSGVQLFPFAAWRWIGSRKGLAAALGAVILGAGLLAGRWGGFSWSQAALLSVLFVTGALFLVQTARIGGRFPTDKFVAVWFLLAVAQLMFVMSWVAARYYLTIVPPAVFLFLRLLQNRHRNFPARFSRACAAAAAALFLFGLPLAWADYLQARANRLIEADLRADGWAESGRRLFYMGDSFTGADLKRFGWRPAFHGTPLAPGDLILVRQVVMPAWWFKPAPGDFALVKVYDYPSRFPVRVMDNASSAGFYASVWGALPFTFTRGPLDRYLLLQAARETTL